MPDGSRPPKEIVLSQDLVDQAVRAYDVGTTHLYIAASVSWLMFLRGDRRADAVAVATHYALWCFDKVYYERFLRLVASAYR